MEIKKTEIEFTEMVGIVNFITDYVFTKDEDGRYLDYMPELYDYAIRLGFAGAFCEYEPSGDYDEDYKNLLTLDLDEIYKYQQPYAILMAVNDKIEYIRSILIKQKQLDIFTPLLTSFADGVESVFNDLTEKNDKFVIEEAKKLIE